MHEPYAVDIATRKLIECHHILRVMVFYIKKISYFTIRVLGKIAAHLNIHTLIAPHRNEIDLPCVELSNIYLIPSPQQLKINYILKH